MITVTIWHNVAHDGDGRPSGMLDGYRPGDPVVRVFAYQADPAGRAPEELAEEAFAICNGHPPGGHAGLTRRYYERGLRSLSFPGNPRCCGGSCWLHSMSCGQASTLTVTIFRVVGVYAASVAARLM